MLFNYVAILSLVALSGSVVALPHPMAGLMVPRLHAGARRDAPITLDAGSNSTDVQGTSDENPPADGTDLSGQVANITDGSADATDLTDPIDFCANAASTVTVTVTAAAQETGGHYHHKGGKEKGKGQGGDGNTALQRTRRQNDGGSAADASPFGLPVGSVDGSAANTSPFAPPDDNVPPLSAPADDSPEIALPAGNGGGSATDTPPSAPANTPDIAAQPDNVDGSEADASPFVVRGGDARSGKGRNDAARSGKGHNDANPFAADPSVAATNDALGSAGTADHGSALGSDIKKRSPQGHHNPAKPTGGPHDANPFVDALASAGNADRSDDGSDGGSEHVIDARKRSLSTTPKLRMRVVRN